MPAPTNHSETDATDGVPFAARHITRPTGRAFDELAGLEQ